MEVKTTARHDGLKQPSLSLWMFWYRYCAAALGMVNGCHRSGAAKTLGYCVFLEAYVGKVLTFKSRHWRVVDAQTPTG